MQKGLLIPSIRIRITNMGKIVVLVYPLAHCTQIPGRYMLKELIYYVHTPAS
jgi:hypothetical protein